MASQHSHHSVLSQISTSTNGTGAEYNKIHACHAEPCTVWEKRTKFYVC